MIRMFARHFTIRLRMLATEPAAAGILLLAGASSIVIWPWLETRRSIDIAGVDEFVTLMAILLWPFLVGIVAEQDFAHLGWDFLRGIADWFVFG